MAAAEDHKDHEDVGRNLAQWLREAGSRARAEPQSVLAPPPPASAAQPCPRADRAPNARYLVMALLAALAWLQFYFLGVLLEIHSLRSVIVFVYG